MKSHRIAYERQRWLRPDWRRFMPPGFEWPDVRDAERKDAERKAREAECATNIDAEALARVRSLIKGVRVEQILLRQSRKYSPDQPRVPAGNPDGGQWTSGGISPGQRIRLAGPPPTNDTPEVPQERPPTSAERTAVLKRIVIFIANGGVAGQALEGVVWLHQHYAEIQAALDPPKTLAELQQAVSDPEAGYEIHHIVEQGSARQDGYSEDRINSPYNLVRVPVLLHRDINAWYQTKNEDFGFLSPRDYLRGRSWNERREIGLDALVRFGVLKP